MGEIDSVAPARSRSARRTVGWVAAVLAVVLLLVFVVGTWNPADLVVLWRFAGNPFIGAMIVCALGLVAAWLLAPIGSEARQVTRGRLRVVLALALLVSLLGYLVAGPRFAVKYDVLAENGSRAIVLYNPGTDFQRLHVWTGTGLGRKHVGDLGKPCGFTTVTMSDPNTLRVKTSYLERDLRLDPDTGRPLDRLGPTCNE